MVKHTLKILRCEHRKIFKKYVWPFYNIMHERVKLQYATGIYQSIKRGYQASFLKPWFWKEFKKIVVHI